MVEDGEKIRIIMGKIHRKEELNLDDLNVLYELGFMCFSHNDFKKLEIIRSKRDVFKDLSTVYRIDKKNTNRAIPKYLMSDKMSENTFDDYVLIGYNPHYVNISDLNWKILPKFVIGSLILECPDNIDSLMMPQYVTGGLFLNGLSFIEEGLVLPNYVGGDLGLNSLISARQLFMSKRVVGNVYMGVLKKVNHVYFPLSVEGDVELDYLVDIKDSILPNYIGGTLALPALKSINGITLPEYIGGYLDLRSLESAAGLRLPDGFELSRLICSEKVLNEIKSNPEKYNAVLPEKKSEISYNIHEAHDYTEKMNANLDPKKAHEKSIGNEVLSDSDVSFDRVDLSNTERMNAYLDPNDVKDKSVGNQVFLNPDISFEGADLSNINLYGTTQKTSNYAEFSKKIDALLSINCTPEFIVKLFKLSPETFGIDVSNDETKTAIENRINILIEAGFTYSNIIEIIKTNPDIFFNNNEREGSSR